MNVDEHPDWKVIEALGGPSKVAAILGFTKAGSVQRVQNWKHRGIPAEVKVLRPDLFLRDWGLAAGAAPASPHA